MRSPIDRMVAANSRPAAKAKSFSSSQRSTLRRDVLALLRDGNEGVAPERQVTYLSAARVVNRALRENSSLEPVSRRLAAMRALSAFISLSTQGTRDGVPARNTDLLPIGHPASTAPHAMTASALRRSRARWLSVDSAISAEARPLVAAAFSYEPGSLEAEHAFARLQALPIGSVPIEFLFSSKLEALTADGNSRAARSARARAQRRDRNGQFAYMGGGLRFRLQLPDGTSMMTVGRIVGYPNDGVSFDVQLPDGRIARVQADKTEAIQAILPDSALPDGPGARAESKIVVDFEPITPEFVDAPAGWRRVGVASSDGVSTFTDGEYNITVHDKITKELGAKVNKAGGINQKNPGTFDLRGGGADPSGKWNKDLPLYEIRDADTGKVVGYAQDWADTLGIVDDNANKKDAQLEESAKAKAQLDADAAKNDAAIAEWSKQRQQDYAAHVEARRAALEAQVADGVDAQGNLVPDNWSPSLPDSYDAPRAPETPGSAAERTQYNYEQSNPDTVPNFDASSTDFIDNIEYTADLNGDTVRVTQKDGKLELDGTQHDNWDSVQATLPDMAQERYDKSRQRLADALDRVGVDPAIVELVRDGASKDDVSAALSDDQAWSDAQNDLATSGYVDLPQKFQKDAWDATREANDALNGLKERPKEQPEQKATLPSWTPSDTRKEIPYDTIEWVDDGQGGGEAVNKSGTTTILDIAGRKVVIVNVNGQDVAFYLSTGAGGKKGVEAGKWYPFFGLGPDDGWINKTTEDEINDYYGSPELRAMAEWLDANVGDVRGDESIPKAKATGAHVDFINESIGIEPTNNSEPDTKEKVDANIAEIKKRVAEGPGAGAPEQPKAILPDQSVESDVPSILSAEELKGLSDAELEARRKDIVNYAWAMDDAGPGFPEGAQKSKLTYGEQEPWRDALRDISNEQEARGLEPTPPFEGTGLGYDAPRPVAELPTVSDQPADAADVEQFNFDVPSGAHQLELDFFEPEGRTEQDSPDYTDDPSVLASKFTEGELTDALAEAIIAQKSFADTFLEQLDSEPLDDGEDDTAPKKKGKTGPKPKKKISTTASGQGKLSFEYGDEYVPAEALYLALQEQGADVDMLVAEMYDTRSGESKNVDALLAARGDARKATLPEIGQDTPEVLPTLDEILSEGADIPEPDVPEAPYISRRQQEKLGTIVALEEINVESLDPGVAELRDFVFSLDMPKDPDQAAENLDKITDQLAPAFYAALSDNATDSERAQVAAWWGIFSHLDNGDGAADSIAVQALAESVAEYMGMDIGDETAMDTLREKLYAKFGSIDDFKESRIKFANGEPGGEMYAAFAQFLAASASPNEKTLYRGSDMSKKDEDFALYTTEGSVVNFAPSSWTWSESMADNYAKRYYAEAPDRVGVVFKLQPGDASSVNVERYSWYFGEHEDVVWGQYVVDSVVEVFSEVLGGGEKPTYEVSLRPMTLPEWARYNADGDYSSLLSPNDGVDMPEGYHSIDPSPYEPNFPEGDNYEGVPEGFTDSPLYLAEMWETADLIDQLRAGIEDGSGLGTFEYPLDDGFEANIPVEAIRDALQIQGFDTNEILQDIANTGDGVDVNTDTNEPDVAPAESIAANEIAAIRDETALEQFDISSWKQVGAQSGSNPGGFYEDESGNRYYVKYPKSQTHAENEVLASALYRAAGVDAAGIYFGRDGNGDLVTVSPLIDGATSDFAKRLDDQQYKDKTQAGFAVDAWLANWDVAGLVFDNVVTDSNGDPVRVDPGGALIFRAQGAPKGGAFGNEVTELDTLRDPSKNPQSYAVFGDMSNDAARDSARKLLPMTPDKIEDMVNAVITDPELAQEISGKLKARRQYIIDYFSLNDEQPEVSVGNYVDGGKDLPPGASVPEPAGVPEDYTPPVNTVDDGPASQPSAPEAPAAGSYLSSDGTPLQLGMKVRSTKDGVEGEVVKFDKNPKYVFVKDASGKKKVRSTKTLEIVNAEGGAPGAPSGASDARQAMIDYLNEEDPAFGELISKLEATGEFKMLPDGAGAYRFVWTPENWTLANVDENGDVTVAIETFNELLDGNSMSDINAEGGAPGAPESTTPTDALPVAEYAPSLLNARSKFYAEADAGLADAVQKLETAGDYQWFADPQNPGTYGFAEYGSPIVQPLIVVDKYGVWEVDEVAIDELMTTESPSGDQPSALSKPAYLDTFDQQMSALDALKDANTYSVPIADIADALGIQPVEDMVDYLKKRHPSYFMNNPGANDVPWTLINDIRDGFTSDGRGDVDQIVQDVVLNGPKAAREYDTPSLDNAIIEIRNALQEGENDGYKSASDVEWLVKDMRTEIEEAMYNGDNVVLATPPGGYETQIDLPSAIAVLESQGWKRPLTKPDFSDAAASEPVVEQTNEPAPVPLNYKLPIKPSPGIPVVTQTQLDNTSYSGTVGDGISYTIQGKLVPNADVFGKNTGKVAGVVLTLTGNTYPIKDGLKKAGYLYNGSTKSWSITLKPGMSVGGVEDAVASMYAGLEKIGPVTGEHYDANFKKDASNVSSPESADEPLADWEKELLAGDSVEAVSDLTPPPGAPTLPDANGNPIWVGAKVTDAQGNEGTVVKLQPNGTYVDVKFPGETKKARSINKVVVSGTGDVAVAKSGTKTATIKPGKPTPTGAPAVVVPEPQSWSESNFEEVSSLSKALSDVGYSTDAASRGASFAADAGDVEDLDVRVMRVLDENGNESILLKYRLTDWAGAQLAKELYQNPDVSKQPLSVKKMKTTDNGMLQLVGDNSFESKSIGRSLRYDVDTKNGRARVTLHRANDDDGKTLTKYSPRAFHNLVQIVLPANATEEDIADALKSAGISDVRPATQADAKILIENRILSVFGKETNPAKNSKGVLREKKLEEIYQAWGFTADDVRVVRGADGRVEYRLSPEIAQKIMDKTGVKAITHNITVPNYSASGKPFHGGSDDERRAAWLEYYLELFGGNHDGLLSTSVRWSEGVGRSGMSSHSDVVSGGADYVFTSPKSYRPDTGSATDYGYTPRIVFRPDSLFERLDIYANQHDNYGRRSNTHDVIKNINPSTYELMFKNRLSWEDLDYVVVPGATLRDDLIAALKARGIFSLGGVPIEQIFLKGGDPLPDMTPEERAKLKAAMGKIQQ